MELSSAQQPVSAPLMAWPLVAHPEGNLTLAPSSRPLVCSYLLQRWHWVNTQDEGPCAGGLPQGQGGG